MLNLFGNKILKNKYKIKKLINVMINQNEKYCIFKKDACCS